jgi:hypothetical protein
MPHVPFQRKRSSRNPREARPYTGQPRYPKFEKAKPSVRAREVRHVSQIALGLLMFCKSSYDAAP